MKIRNFWMSAATITACASVLVGVFVWKNFRGVAPAIAPPSRDIVSLLSNSDNESVVGKNATNFPLTLPAGFAISIFADKLPGARVLVFDQGGNLWVTRTSAGAVTELKIRDGKVVSQADVFSGLKGPHGLVFDLQDPSVLYVAEEDKISRGSLSGGGDLQKIADLPSAGGHSTRTLLFGTDGRLYVSMGSSCNVCTEKDSRRAKIFSLNKDGSDMREVASGLRNSVFMTNNPRDGKIWATEMGRDLLGDNVPPDEINVISQGGNYGWPYCYGKNIHDNDFDPRSAVTCQDKIPSHIDIQAHSAPLGLAFVPADSSWPQEYKNNLIVAFHGSWNRSVPTGYKIVRFQSDERGNLVAEKTAQTDFISGWLGASDALGRPVGIVFENSDMYVSDDKAGVIYRVTYDKNAE